MSHLALPGTQLGNRFFSQVPTKAPNLRSRIPLSSTREGNEESLFLYFPDRIHEISLWVKQMFHDPAPTLLSQLFDF